MKQLFGLPKLVCIISSSQTFLSIGIENKLNNSVCSGAPLPPQVGIFEKYPLNFVGIILFAETKILENKSFILYLNDYIQRTGTPLFLIGMPVDISLMEKKIPTSNIKGTFMRPIDINDVVSTVTNFISFYSKDNSKKTVLVVDDCGTFLRSTKALFEDEYQVVLASSASMALNCLSSRKPDLILLDYEMPDINGKKFFEMIKKDNDFNGVPVIFLTSANDAETVNAVMRLRPAGYLLKTSSAEVIKSTVKNFFNKGKRQYT